MSIDKDVTENVIEILEDGKAGFADAAEKLKDSSRPDLVARFAQYATQRAQFSQELESMAATYGDDVDESGSARAVMHRAWMAVKDTLSGSDPDGVLDAAEQGEDYAIKAYEDALKHDISANLRTVLERQFTAVKTAHDEVKALRNAVS